MASRISSSRSPSTRGRERGQLAACALLLGLLRWMKRNRFVSSQTRTATEAARIHSRWSRNSWPSASGAARAAGRRGAVPGVWPACRRLASGSGSAPSGVGVGVGSRGRRRESASTWAPRGLGGRSSLGLGVRRRVGVLRRARGRASRSSVPTRWPTEVPVPSSPRAATTNGLPVTASTTVIAGRGRRASRARRRARPCPRDGRAGSSSVPASRLGPSGSSSGSRALAVLERLPSGAGRPRRSGPGDHAR